MKWKYIFLSARFKPLIVGMGPIWLGICLSFSGWHNFSWILNGSIVLAVICIQIATHFFNDSLDFIKGADGPGRQGPKRPVQKALIAPSELFKAGKVSLFLASLPGLYLISQGGWPIALVGLMSLALAYLYTGGPYPLAYTTGLADFFVILFFGLIPTSFVFYLNTGFFGSHSFLAGLQCGLLALSLLVVNNLRDEEEDRRAGKKTLVACLGQKWGVREWFFAHYMPYLIGVFWLFKGFGLACFLPLFLLPFSIYMSRLLQRLPQQKTLKDEELQNLSVQKIFHGTLFYYLLFVSLLSGGFIF